MGNNLCSGSRNCEPTNNVQFGMLCRRPRQLVIKFEKKDTYYKKRRKRKTNSKLRQN